MTVRFCMIETEITRTHPGSILAFTDWVSPLPETLSEYRRENEVDEAPEPVNEETEQQILGKSE